MISWSINSAFSLKPKTTTLDLRTDHINNLKKQKSKNCFIKCSKNMIKFRTIFKRKL